MRILPSLHRKEALIDAGENCIGASNYDSPQILRAALPCRTPPGLEGSKGRPALMGVRGILIKALVR